MTDKDRETAREIIERVKAWLGGTMVPVPTDFITAALEAVRAEERERCAGIVQAEYDRMAKRSYPPPKILAELATAIRKERGMLSDWQPFDGTYEKRWYDVRTPTLEVVSDCWPNAGYMNATDGSGRFWAPGDCEVRPTTPAAGE